ncbi:putative bifunctional diguanylate cyclase/phosphodiesterase [Pengzhenrongella frigida]|uniref:GGDEF and EAL domain-containing protein n=1 Tax=Pengzhenrongella frigida TaxID=1259133 RepID=A0A4Q5N286_9MICO|nr:GGDEF and EAL domain-containing protein [Cellulomonas sp. HLT2-17]RYV52288.1 GGDEF and EAL domain-containing protein [Cellulomonas sp. HLT2-17]
MSAESLTEGAWRPADDPDPRRTSVPQRLRFLEPLTCLALAVHALAIQVVADEGWASAINGAVAILVVLGVVGLVGWQGPASVTVRAAAILVLGYLLMALNDHVSGYFLLWYFVLAAVYPLVLPREIGRLVAVVVPITYLALLPLEAADGPAPVALVRAFSLALVAAFVHTAASAYRAAVADRDRALALLDTYVDATPVGLGFWDLDLRFRRLNDAMAALAGLPVKQHLGRAVTDIATSTPPLALNLHRVLMSGQPVGDVELTDGERAWTSSYFPVRLGGTVLGVGAVVIDVTDQRQAARALAHSATHDALTGLPNRALFSDRLEVALQQATRGGGVVAVLFCDVDRFKVINDSLGHAAGDDLLRAAAARLTGVVRAGDTVARLGGDEFAVLCQEVTDLEEAKAVGERLCGVLRDPIEVGDRIITSTMSVGVTICVAGEQDAADVLRDADVAMYQAKDAGRDRVAVFDARLRTSVSERFEFHGALRRAVDQGEITVAYQPVLALGEPGPDGEPSRPEVVGVEALARWHRPGHGDVSPAVFIPMAEDLGLIHALGEQVLRAACTAVRRWRDETGRPLTVAVNLSARQLAEAGCVDDVAAVLSDVGLPPTALQLEITESVLMVDLEHSLRQLGALRARGVRVAVDDFGTGYSSLAYLRDLPVDILKIDQSFTRRLPGDQEMLAFIVQLARAIGATTVVEGVETREQLDVVTRVGCDQAQGYYLSRPLSPDAAAEYLGATPCAVAR